MQPARASTAPRMLTDKLVTRPEHAKAKPKAKTKGHAVDAGTSISRGARGLSLIGSVVSKVAIVLPQRSSSVPLASAAQHVNNSENHHPHGIHKVPVHREDLHATRLLRAHASGQSKDRDNQEHDQACGDVKGVQADQRVVSCSK